MKPHVCPASHAGFLSTSLRRLVQNPEKILREFVLPGRTVADIGCGPGFFTLPMARMVGPLGKVIAADLQPEMLDKLRKRAEAAGLRENITYHRCGTDRIGLSERVDFVLAFYMVHEVPDPYSFFQEVRGAVNPGGGLLFVEPKFHVTRKGFQRAVETAERAGWTPGGFPKILLSRTVLLQ